MHQLFYCDGLIDVYDLTLGSCAFADIRYSGKSFYIKQENRWRFSRNGSFTFVALP